MSELRMKIKLGEREFEIEGTADSVKRSFESFKWLIAPPPDATAPLKESAAEESPEQSRQEATIAPVPLERIVRIRGPIVSLMVPPRSEKLFL